MRRYRGQSPCPRDLWNTIRCRRKMARLRYRQALASWGTSMNTWSNLSKSVTHRRCISGQTVRRLTFRGCRPGWRMGFDKLIRKRYKKEAGTEVARVLRLASLVQCICPWLESLILGSRSLLSRWLFPWAEKSAYFINLRTTWRSGWTKRKLKKPNGLIRASVVSIRTLPKK